MDTVTRVQIFDEADCIPHSINILGKGMDPIILPPDKGKLQGRLDSLTSVMQPVNKNENSKFKPVKLCLKEMKLCHILPVQRDW